MKTRMLGKNLSVSEIGLGCMTIGKDYSNDAKREAERIIRRAHEMGVTMFDTAELYAEGRNESLVGEALKPIRDKVKIATKCGVAFEAGHIIGNVSGDFADAGGAWSRASSVKAVSAELLNGSVRRNVSVRCQEYTL